MSEKCLFFSETCSLVALNAAKSSGCGHSLVLMGSAASAAGSLILHTKERTLLRYQFMT